MNLLDTYSLTGTEKADFEKAVKEMAEVTKTMTINTEMIQSLSVCNLKEFENEDTQAFYMLGNLQLDKLMSGGKMQVGRVYKSSFGEDILNEMKNSTNLCFLIDKEKYPVSSLALLTLTARAGVTGESTFNRQNLIRNMHIADTLQRGGKTTIVYREENGVKKIFAVMGRAYNYIPQTILLDIITLIDKDKKLGISSPVCWGISHSITSYMETFPEAAEDFERTYGIKDKTPGIIIETSDIGYCSVTVKSVLKTKGSYVVMDEIKFQHTPKTTPERIITAIDKDIFDKIRNLPECLMTLMGISLNYDEAVKITKKAIDGIPRKCLSKERTKELKACIIEEYSPEISYTLYDVADKFIELPGRIHGLDNTTITELRKICGKIPYQLEKLAKEKEEEIVVI